MRRADPPLEHLVMSSNTSLESFELSRLNAVANLRKEIRQIVDDWVQAEIEARIARWVLERRRTDAADSQPHVPHYLEPVPAFENAACILHAAEEGRSPPHGRQVSPAVKSASRIGRSSDAASRSVLLESPLPREVDQPGHQPSLFEELSYGEELSAETETSTLQREFAARALRPLERIVRGRPELLRRKLQGAVVERIALLGTCREKCLLPSFAEPLPVGRVAQQGPLTDSGRHSTYVRTGPDRNMIGTGAGLVAEAPARKSARRGWHSELRLPSAVRPPLRQFQFLWQRSATVS